MNVAIFQENKTPVKDKSKVVEKDGTPDKAITSSPDLPNNNKENLSQNVATKAAKSQVSGLVNLSEMARNLNVKKHCVNKLTNNHNIN